MTSNTAVFVGTDGDGIIVIFSAGNICVPFRRDRRQILPIWDFHPATPYLADEAVAVATVTIVPLHPGR
jgi:hypothetical protein